MGIQSETHQSRDEKDGILTRKWPIILMEEPNDLIAQDVNMSFGVRGGKLSFRSLDIGAWRSEITALQGAHGEVSKFLGPIILAMQLRYLCTWVLVKTWKYGGGCEISKDMIFLPRGYLSFMWSWDLRKYRKDLELHPSLEQE